VVKRFATFRSCPDCLPAITQTGAQPGIIGLWKKLEQLEHRIRAIRRPLAPWNGRARTSAHRKYHLPLIGILRLGQSCANQLALAKLQDMSRPMGIASTVVNHQGRLSAIFSAPFFQGTPDSNPVFGVGGFRITFPKPSSWHSCNQAK